MTILAIDDEPVMLVHLETELRKVFPKADIVTFVLLLLICFVKAKSLLLMI